MEIQNLTTDGRTGAAIAPQTTAIERPVLELEDLYHILQADPNDSFIALDLARRLGAAGRDREALKILRSVVKIDSRFETVLALGLCEYKLQMEDEAFRHLQEALLIAPDGAPELFEIFKTLGNIFVRHRDFDSAEDNYFKAHRMRPGSDILLVNLGTLCVQRGGWDEALHYFRSALALNNGNDKAWVGLAIAHRMKGDFELSWGNLEAALGYNALNEVALTLALDWGPAEGREPRVHEMLRGFLVHGGWNERFSLAFSWLCWKRGESELARLEVERLLAVNPVNGQALALLEQMRSA